MPHKREVGLRDVKQTRAWIIAASFGLAWLLILIAGADRPPPPGFAVVLAILLALVIAIGRAIPWLWHVQADKGARRVLAYTLVPGAAVGFAIALGFAISGSGEPSRTDPTASSTLTWLLVLTLVGALNGALIGGVTVLARRSSTAS